MEWNEAQERARFFDFSINITNGDKTWFNAIKTWDYTGQTFNLEVKPETNEFRFTKMHGLILIDSMWLGSYDNDVQFLRWQKHFMETIEKFMPKKEGIIEIPLEKYKSLKKNSTKLAKLEAYGVDNWSYYGEALSDPEGLFEDEEEE